MINIKTCFKKRYIILVMYVPNKAGMRFWLPKIDEISDGASYLAALSYIFTWVLGTLMYIAIVCQTKSSIFFLD